MPPIARKPLSLGEVVLIVAIFAGWFIASSLHAVLAGFPVPHISDKDALGLVVFECLAFLLACAVLWARGWRRKDLGIRITWINSFVGLLLCGVGMVVNIALWVLLEPAIGGADFMQQFQQAISVSLPVAVLLSIVNGAFEEFFLCRYLVEGFARYGVWVALGVSALVRVMYHLYQGPLGAILVLAFGLLVTFYYWRYRQVWPAMLAHMTFDLMALA